MPITYTKIYAKTDPTVPFISDTSDSDIQAHFEKLRTDLAPLLDSGKMSADTQISPDNLVRTAVYTLADLDSLAKFDTDMSLELDATFIRYMTLYPGTADIQNSNRCILGGIEAPFTRIITFTYPDNGAISEALATAFNNASRMTGFEVTSTTTKATFVFNNADDFNQHLKWHEAPLTQDLVNAGAVRTYTYQ